MWTTPPGKLTVRLTGAGPGGVAFEARSPGGTVLAKGFLTTDSDVTCSSSEGDLRMSFTGDARGGTIRYVASSREGVAVEMPPGAR